MNTSVIELEEVSEFSPLLHGWLYITYNLILATVLYLAFKVQNGLYKAFERLGPRAINSILIPVWVFFNPSKSE